MRFEGPWNSIPKPGQRSKSNNNEKRVLAQRNGKKGKKEVAKDDDEDEEMHAASDDDDGEGNGDLDIEIEEEPSKQMDQVEEEENEDEPTPPPPRRAKTTTTKKGKEKEKENISPRAGANKKINKGGAKGKGLDQDSEHEDAAGKKQKPLVIARNESKNGYDRSSSTSNKQQTISVSNKPGRPPSKQLEKLIKSKPGPHPDFLPDAVPDTITKKNKRKRVFEEDDGYRDEKGDGGSGAEKTLAEISIDTVDDLPPEMITDAYDRAVIKPSKQKGKEVAGWKDCDWVFRNKFKKEDYRGKQKEAMQAVMQGKDLLFIGPTGLGKSVVFQVPAVAESHGVTLVIEPLLCLMRDQVNSLKILNVPAYQLSSESSFLAKKRILDELKAGHPRIRLLYVTPERLATKEFRDAMALTHAQGEFNRIVVDEVHCLVEWGHSFRDKYRLIGDFKKFIEIRVPSLPSIPITGLTATAHPKVQDEIVKNLRMREGLCEIITHTLDRPNLYYEVRYFSEQIDRDEKKKALVSLIKGYKQRSAKNNSTASGIVYCWQKVTCDEVARFLEENGLKARAYHRGVNKHELGRIQEMWKKGALGVPAKQQIDVVVATIAFGLGVDKPDCRFVIHYDLPRSFEGYTQETGRAGRDGGASRCTLFFSEEDAVRLQHYARMDQYEVWLNKQGRESSVQKLLKYARNSKNCRHVSICKYFGEKELSTSCSERGMCDICKKGPDEIRRRQREVLISNELPPATQNQLQLEVSLNRDEINQAFEEEPFCPEEEEDDEGEEAIEESFYEEEDEQTKAKRRQNISMDIDETSGSDEEEPEVDKNLNHKHGNDSEPRKSPNDNEDDEYLVPEKSRPSSKALGKRPMLDPPRRQNAVPVTTDSSGDESDGPWRRKEIKKLMPDKWEGAKQYLDREARLSAASKIQDQLLRAKDGKAVFKTISQTKLTKNERKYVLSQLAVRLESDAFWASHDSDHYGRLVKKTTADACTVSNFQSELHLCAQIWLCQRDK